MKAASAAADQKDVSQQRFRLLIDATPMLVWMAGPDQSCIYFNRRWLEFTGRTLDQELGDGWTAGIHPSDLQHWLSVYRTAFDARQPFTVEYRLRRHDGAYRWLLGDGLPQLGPDGVFEGYIGSCLDITVRKEAEEDAARLAAIVASSDDAIVGKTLAGVITSWNAGAERIYGYSAEEMLGQPFSLLVPPERSDELGASLERMHRGERLDHFETVRLRKDGGRIDVSVSYSPIKDGHGHLVGTSVITRDISARNQGEQIAEFLADASDALASVVDLKKTLEKVASLAVPYFADWCAIDLLDADGQLKRLAVAHVDPAKVELAHEIHRRWPPDPSSKRGVFKILATGYSELISEIDEGMLAASIADPELLTIVRQLGLRSYMGVPLIVRGKTLGAISFTAAESGRRFGASELAAAEDLAHRAAVAVENAQLYSALREADRRKDEFLAVLAHELRNPLAPIQNALNILKLSDAQAPVAANAREVAQRQLTHLTRLVDDLLDVSRIMRGKIELRIERIELASVVASGIETARPTIDAAQHALHVSLPAEPVWLQADPVRLAQVLANLLSNAAKYTEPQGQIWLDAAREADAVVLRVRDSGIGIAPDVLPRLFEIFMQVAPATSRSQGGLGLGLTLVKNLVEMHGGTVAATSAGLGRGSEFVVRLPLPAKPAAEQLEATTVAIAAPPTKESEGKRRRQILVVDDNVDAANTLAMLLRLSGHDLRVVHSGPEALAAVAARQPELILLDIGMPHMNGYQVARTLRQQYSSAQLKLVALTGWGQEQDRQESKAAGFDHHLTKPVELGTLTQLLAELDR